MKVKMFFLVIAFVATFYGCNQIEESSVKEEPIVIVDDVLSVEEDYYHSFEFEIEDSKELLIDIISRSSVDFEIFIFDKVGFLQWKQNETENTKVFLQHLVSSEGSFYVTLELEEGNYYFVIDNTDSGMVSPPFNFISDDVICELILTIQ